jgi:hypothetical protein
MSAGFLVRRSSGRAKEIFLKFIECLTECAVTGGIRNFEENLGTGQETGKSGLFRFKNVQRFNIQKTNHPGTDFNNEQYPAGFLPE